jgi:hypothetical protein
MSIIAGEDILAADILAMVSFETTAATTHSLTTVALEKVLVIAKGYAEGPGSSYSTINLKYNGVTKDSVQVGVGNGSSRIPFCLMYTEVPGAATQNITIDGGTIGDADIMVVKLKQS